MKHYEQPKIEFIGSLQELTLAVNKVGANPDIYSAITTDVVVGSIVPRP